jgi:hypothetical protein
MAPPGFKLLDGLHKLISKLAPEFRQMLTHAEYLDTCNGKKAWTHEELLVHLHRHAAKALQQPRPANVTALFASADPTPDQVGFIARGNPTSTCYNWLRNSCPGAVCPNGYAHPPSEQGDISKLPQCELFLAGKCYRTRCGFKHGEQAATALVAIPTHTKPDGPGGKGRSKKGKGNKGGRGANNHPTAPAPSPGSSAATTSSSGTTSPSTSSQATSSSVSSPTTSSTPPTGDHMATASAFHALVADQMP